jgi:uncharacterized membrane protein YgaE (UPF0421/DUF939 family)
MKIEFKKIGMRNIKTSIAVVISILISRAFKMEYPFFAAIAAVISMQGSVESSFIAGRNRMFGTIIGALIGFICGSIQPENILLVGLGIIVVIYLCNILKWKESSSIGCVVFCAIMLNLKGSDPMIYSLNRILDTFIGIVVSLGVNYFIAPPKSGIE